MGIYEMDVLRDFYRYAPAIVCNYLYIAVLELLAQLFYYSINNAHIAIKAVSPYLFKYNIFRYRNTIVAGKYI